MSNNGDCCTKEADVAFNELARELAGAVDQASYNAEAYRNKVRKLDDFELECENKEPIGCDKKLEKMEPDSILYKLKRLISQLKASNQKNDEILAHFSTLV